MMPKLPPIPVGWIESLHGALRANHAFKITGPQSVSWSIALFTEDQMRDYARAVAEECAAKCEAIAESYSRNGIADKAISECAAAIRKLKEEIGR